MPSTDAWKVKAVPVNADGVTSATRLPRPFRSRAELVVPDDSIVTVDVLKEESDDIVIVVCGKWLAVVATVQKYEIAFTYLRTTPIKPAMIAQLLKEIGIDVGLAVGGFFGSLITIGRHKDWKTASVAVLSGMGSATYLTPLVIDFLPNPTSSQYAVAFVLGFLGLRGVELITDRIFPPEKQDDQPNQ